MRSWPESAAAASSPTMIPFKTKKNKNKPFPQTPKEKSDDSGFILASLERSDPRRSNNGAVVSEIRKKEGKRVEEGSDKLPERYEMLCELFNAMVSSTQLLRLKRSSPTFMNVSRNVGSLTDRRFSMNHLAQMKHILPEAILAKKIRVKDEETCCMKEELHITLDADALKTNGNEKGVGGPSSLKKVFHSRISEFYKTHPEVDDIPEGTIPALFYPLKNGGDTIISGSDTLSTAYHIPPSYRKPFSHITSSLVEDRKSDIQGTPASCDEEGKADVLGSEASWSDEPKSADYSKIQLPSSSVVTTPKKDISTQLPSSPMIVSPLKASKASSTQLPLSSMFATPSKEGSTQLPLTSIFATPSKESDSTEDSLGRKGASSTCKTPAGLVSTPTRLMSATPCLKPPKRPSVSPLASPEKLVRRSGRIKSLKFGRPEDDSTLVDHQADQAQGSISDHELSFLPKSLLQSVREEEKKLLEENDPAISQEKKHHRMLARLPQLLDTIHFLFQSINCAVITKDEFIYKVIIGSREIVDRLEVEEQLMLLQELAPEYISEQSCLSGDTLIRLNKLSCVESVRAKLLEVK
ncbi:CDT1-like protein [Drosera capensis]